MGKRSDEAVFEFTSNIIKSGLKIIFDNLDQFFNQLQNTTADEMPFNLKAFVTEYSQKPDDFNLLYLKTSPHGEVFYNLKKCSYKDHILEIPNVGSQNLLANKVLTDLFGQFETLIHTDFSKSDVFKMLPIDCKGYIRSAHDAKSENSPARVVVDFISGMTDDYALRLWEMISKPHVSRIPEMTFGGMMSSFLALPFKYELIFSFRIQDQAKEMKALESKRRMAHFLYGQIRSTRDHTN